MSDQNIKKFFIIVFTTSFFSLAVALYVEYVLGFKPCILCIYQRIPYAIALLISLIAFFNDSLSPHGTIMPFTPSWIMS